MFYYKTQTESNKLEKKEGKFLKKEKQKLFLTVLAFGAKLENGMRLKNFGTFFLPFHES